MHATAGEGPNSNLGLSAERVRIEVLRAAVARLLEQLDQEEGDLEVLGTEAQILIEAAYLLVIKADVEKLARVDGLCSCMREVQPSHCFVRELRVYAE